MIVLALDTTTRAGSLALVRDRRLLEVFVGDGSRTHAARLPGDLLDCLTRHGLSLQDVDLFAVAAGPGSFTGLRIGIATIQGLAFASGRNLVGVSALEALALSALDPQDGADDRAAADTIVGAWMDAQRREVYAQLFGSAGGAGVRPPPAGAGELTPLDAPAVGSPDDILLAWDVTLREAPPFRLVLVGDGILAYRDLLTARLPRAQRLDVVPALAPAIAEVARRRAESGLAVPPHAVKPIYVRRPDAELARDKRARSTPAPDGPGGDACP